MDRNVNFIYSMVFYLSLSLSLRSCKRFSSRFVQQNLANIFFMEHYFARMEIVLSSTNDRSLAGFRILSDLLSRIIGGSMVGVGPSRSTTQDPLTQLSARGISLADSRSSFYCSLTFSSSSFFSFLSWLFNVLAHLASSSLVHVRILHFVFHFV